MEKQEKERIVSELCDRVNRATGITLVDYTGLNVADATELRRKCRASDVEYQVVKNTLTRRAIEGFPFKEEIAAVLNQPTALAFGYDDPFAPVKVIAGFAKSNENVRVKAAMVEGRFYSGESVKELAKAPSRKELIGQLIGCVQGPIAGFSGVCSGILRQLVGVMAAIKDKKTE